MTASCPCCGAPVRIEPWEAALEDLTPMQRRIAEAVAKRPGLRRAELTDLVYAQDPDGGPMTADSSVASQISRMNQRLGRHGFRIASRHGGGYLGYSVRPVQVSA